MTAVAKKATAKKAAKKAVKKATKKTAVKKTTKPRSIGLGATLSDDTTRAVLYEGASKNQLCMLFEAHMRDVTEATTHVEPCGSRQGYPIYKVKDVAPYIVKGKINVEESIRRMSAKDLPPALTREFWLAQAARLRYEEDVGDLWRTSEVIRVVGDAFKTLKMSILLMQDQVERNNVLTSQQRDEIRQLSDALLNELADSLVKSMGKAKKETGDAGENEKI